MVIYTVYACKQMVDRRRISKRELDQRETCGWGERDALCISKTDDW